MHCNSPLLPEYLHFHGTVPWIRVYLPVPSEISCIPSIHPSATEAPLKSVKMRSPSGSPKVQKPFTSFRR